MRNVVVSPVSCVLIFLTHSSRSPVCCFIPLCLQLFVSSFQNLVVYLLNWIEMSQHSTFHWLFGALPTEATHFSQCPPFRLESASHSLPSWVRNFLNPLWDSSQPISWIDCKVFIYLSLWLMGKSRDFPTLLLCVKLCCLFLISNPGCEFASQLFIVTRPDMHQPLSAILIVI